MKPVLTYVSLFSGIEACSVAMSRIEEVEWRPVFFSEIDPFASAVRLIFFIEKEGRAWATERVCQEALEEVAEEFLPHIKALTFPAYAGINGAFVAATSIAVAHGASAVKVQEFIDRFRDGKNLGDGNPILRLREIMRDVKRLSKESRFSVYAYYLAAFLTGRRIRLNYRTIEVRQAHDLLVAAAEK